MNLGGFNIRLYVSMLRGEITHSAIR